MIIKASDWEYNCYDTEYNDDDEEILILEFEAINEDNELFIYFDPNVPFERKNYNKGIIQIYKNDHTYIEKNMCTEDDIVEIYKLLDMAKVNERDL